MPNAYNHFINGEFTNSNSTETGEVYNPATGEVTGSVKFATQETVNEAVNAAKQASLSWRQVPVLQRTRIIFKFKALVEANFEKLAQCLTSEHGKVITDARAEIQRGLEVVEFACGMPHLLKGEFSENVGTNVDCYNMRKPVGVCVGITPFNFPGMVPMWMFPIAIACGNAFILKPSEKDPGVCQLLAALMHEAGVPPGVFNLVQGDKVAVDALLKHPGVDAISFVGSTPIAQYVYETGCAHNKRVQAFAGAKNHCIVMPDADMDLVADGLFGAAYGSAGERCMAISVAVAVTDDVADTIVQKLKERVGTIKIMNGMNEEAEMGPLVTKAHLERVRSYVDTGEQEGAMLAIDGRQLDIAAAGLGNGFFLGCSLFDHVTPEMKIYQDEIFGPVLCVVRVPDFDAALALINQNAFGNGTAIYTNSGEAAREFASHVEVGMVGINIPIPVPVAFFSFGGWKASAFNDTNMHGTEGVHFYTRYKTVTARWPKHIASGAEFVIPTMK